MSDRFDDASASSLPERCYGARLLRWSEAHLQHLKTALPARAIVLLSMVAVVLLIPSSLLLAREVSGYTNSGAHAPRKATATQSSASLTSPIALENHLPGSSGWLIPPAQRSTTQIQAYLGATSARAGATVTMYVSTQQAGTLYTIEVYRLGWYGGLGGRLMLSAKQTGQTQGYYDALKGQLVNCASCRVDPTVGLVEANWRPSYQLTILSDWLSGVYLVKFTDAQGMQTAATFDVTGDDRSTYVLVTTDTTTAAYNDWGGFSLYRRVLSHTARDGEQSAEQAGGHGAKVSLDRPVAGWGDEQGLLYEINGIRWLERLGYDVSYLSSVDLHEAPERLLTHRAYLVFGHDEYWSEQMRASVERARDAGVGLGFFGANIGYWQIRFEPDSQGVADRTIVGYKSAAHDPLRKQDPASVTVQWRQPPVNRPENALIGEMYSGWTLRPHGVPWTLQQGASSDLLAGTDLRAGQSYGCDVVGYEWDSVTANGKTPMGLHVLGSSAVTDHTGHHGVANTTAYRASSGALVFAAGTVQWGLALDDDRLFTDPNCSGKTQSVPGLQRLTANVLAALVQRGADEQKRSAR